MVYALYVNGKYKTEVVADILPKIDESIMLSNTVYKVVNVLHEVEYHINVDSRTYDVVVFVTTISSH